MWRKPESLIAHQFILTAINVSWNLDMEHRMTQMLSVLHIELLNNKILLGYTGKGCAHHQSEIRQ